LALFILSGGSVHNLRSKSTSAQRASSASDGGAAVKTINSHAPKRAVYPRDVRQMLWQLRDARNAYAHEHKGNVMPLVAAESISEGARDVLQAENVGFFDMGGSLFVPAKGAYLYIDRPVPKTIEKSVRSLFIGKRSQVLHALLMKREEWLGVTELSHLAEVSPATASEILP
jgi:hypothetical protein